MFGLYLNTFAAIAEACGHLLIAMNRFTAMKYLLKYEKVSNILLRLLNSCIVFLKKDPLCIDRLIVISSSILQMWTTQSIYFAIASQWLSSLVIPTFVCFAPVGYIMVGDNSYVLDILSLTFLEVCFKLR